MTTMTQTTKPTLDIILPVYNTERYLDQCIESIVNQKFNDWHLIIMDDGSTDSSPEICDRWAQRDKRITVVHKQNSGQADSRNIAIEMCTAEFVGFVDSDDWIEPDMYSFMLDIIQKHDADIAVCNFFNDDKKGSHCKKASNKIEVLDHNQTTEYVIRNKIYSYLWMMVIRRSYLKARIPKHMCFEDYAILPHWFANSRRVIRTMRPLYHYRARRSSIIHSPNPKQEYTFLLAEENRFEFYRNTKHASLAELYLIRRAIRVAKHIAQTNETKTTINSYLDRIKPTIAQYGPKHLNKLKTKEKQLYKLLMYNSNLFIGYQKIARLFKKSNNNKSERYFD